MTRWAEVIAIFGPTASGKSAVADSLAGRLGTEVVSADALQVYRGLPVLTNQPTTPTRLVAIRDLDAEMSVGEYGALAHAAVDELVESSGSAVVAGGTGLYLRAALVDLAVPPSVEPASACDWRSPTTRAPLWRTLACRSSTREPRRPCIRTIAVVSFGRSSLRKAGAP